LSRRSRSAQRRILPSYSFLLTFFSHPPPLFDRSAGEFNRSLNCLFTAANPESKIQKALRDRSQAAISSFLLLPSYFCLRPFPQPATRYQQAHRHPMRRFLYIILCTATAMIGYTIHGSLFWSVMNFIFCPISWAKWLICKEVSLSVIKQTFAFLFT
jgi:hypothetical protein